MLTTLKNAFKIKEIRKKLLFTFLMLVVIRIGCQLPVPGVNRHFFSNWFAAQTGDTFSFFNAFTGGSFENIIDHYSAFNDCDPEAGRNAERWGRGA